MLLAKTKYQVIIDKNKWNAPSPEESQILALKAEVAEMKASHKKTNKNKQNNQNKLGKYNKFAKKPQWMFIEPEQPNMYKPRAWNGTNWYWCGKKTNGQCEAYRTHRGKECQGKDYLLNKKRKPDDTKSQDETPDNKVNSNKKRVTFQKPKKDTKPIKLAKALATVVEEEGNDSDSS